MSVLVVTGGSRGIGRAIVLRAARAGHHVAFAARDVDAIRATEAEARALDGLVIGVRCDVGNDDEVRRLFERATDDLGPVDGAIANAAVSVGGLLPLTDDACIDAILRTNFEGVVHTVRAAGDAMRRFSRRGNVVVMGSLAGNGAPSNAVYSASKAALAPLVTLADRELRRFGARCHLLVPGLVDTELVSTLPSAVRERLVACAPLRRSASADELAGLALALALGAGRALATPLNATAGLQEIPG